MTINGSGFTGSTQAWVGVAKNADLDGTPFFVINGTIISGVRPFSVFEQVVTRALAEAESAQAVGARP